MNKIIKLILCLTVISITSCSHFEDLNTDPARSVKADPASLISGVQLRLTGEREVQWRSTAYFHMGVSQMITDGYTIALGAKYVTRFDYFEYMWKSYYQMINNLQCAQEEAEKQEQLTNYAAMARLMKVYIFSELTDTYGDIPYSEAVRGYSDGIIYPRYDTQKDIYTDFFHQLDTIPLMFDERYPMEGDLFYDGNIGLWNKFANSLRLRLAMRLVNVDEAWAQREVQKAIEGGLMQDYTETTYVKHENVDVSQTAMPEIRGNGFSQMVAYADELTFACATYTDYLKTTNDPRLKMMFGIYGYPKGQSTARTDFKSSNPQSIECTQEFNDATGKLQGCPAGGTIFDAIGPLGLKTVYLTKDGQEIEVQPMFNILQIRRELVGLDAPGIYLPYSEVELWLAEAEERWGLTGESAESHFQKAILAHISILENIQHSIKANPTEVAAYINSIWNSDSNKLRLINMQHYVCNFFNGIEAHANWKRSGYPELVPANRTETDSELEQLGSLIPRRMPYPLTEINYNSTHVSQHLYEGKNFWGAPVWWDGSTTRGVKK